MSSVLPVLSGREVVKIFAKAGWAETRQKGSHIILTKPGHIASLSVPDHKEVARGTLRALLRAAGISVEEFTLLKSS
jgi:predicted RNA binding protein YcfA (HicA-like mRNA interferase family)